MGQRYDDKVKVREVVGVFDGVDSLRDAMSELQQNGFMRQELGFLADEKTVQEKMGRFYKRVEDLKHDPRTPRAMFMPDEPVGEAEAAFIGVPFYLAAATASAVVVATGGTLLAAITAAVAAGAGAGTLGSVLSNFISKHHADYIQTQIENGGMIIWVNAATPEREEAARRILAKYHGHDIQAHDIPALVMAK